MKKVSYLLILFFWFISSCNQTDNKQIITSKVKEQIENAAFKSNSTVEFKNFDLLKVDIIDENRFDTILIKTNKKYLDYYYDLAQIKMEQAKSKLKLQNLYKMADIGINNKDDFDKYKNEASQYLDSVQYYLAIDSTIQERIKKRVTPEVVYKASFFIKAIVKSKTDSQNVLDSLHWYFDKNLNILNQ